MKITVERDAFAKAVSTVSRLLVAKPIIPILSNVLLTVEGDKVSVKGTNLDMETTAVVACDREGDNGAITLPGKLLADTLNGLPKGAQVSVEWTDDKSATLRAGARCRYKLYALPADMFPAFAEIAEPTKFQMPASMFAAAIDTAEFAIADDRSRIYLNGLNISVADPQGHKGLGGIKGKRLIFVALDAHEMGWTAMTVPDGAEDVPNVIVPKQAVNEMARIASDADERADVDISISKQFMSLACGNLSISTKLVDATYAGYMQAIPTSGYRELIVDTADLHSALSRLIGIGDSSRAQITLQSGSLTLALASNVNGEAEERVDAQWDHDEVIKKINAKGFLRVLPQIKTELCCIRFNEAGLPILFNEFIGEKIVTERVFLSMPMEGS